MTHHMLMTRMPVIDAKKPSPPREEELNNFLPFCITEKHKMNFDNLPEMRMKTKIIHWMCVILWQYLQEQVVN